jgi:two-component system KDP operon response regulator KdpE
MTHSHSAVIIDDEIQIRRLLKIALESNQYKVHEAETGQLGLSEIAYHRPDVVLLDLGLPDMDGLAVLKRLREWSKVPVLILSVRNQEEQKVEALDAGADDYVTKPFNTSELLARLRAIQRRNQENAASPIFTAGDLTVDFSSHQVLIKNQEVSLTSTEYALFKLLVQNAGKVVTQKQILKEVWGPQAEQHTAYIRVYIAHLRKKIETHTKPNCLIKTESGIGYRLLIQ